MLPLFDRNTRLPAPLQQALDGGALVLAASLRAARALQRDFFHDRLQEAEHSGPGACPTPAIEDWHSWITTLYAAGSRRAAGVPTLLTPMQEQALWRRALGADSYRVVAPRRLAELAQSGYALLGSYCAHGLRRAAADSSFGSTHEDAERFLVWAHAFDALCAARGVLSRTRVEEQLCSPHFPLPPLPSQLVLVGFDRVTPAQAALLARLVQAGTSITHYAPPGHSAPPQRVVARDPRQELESCATWCRARLSEHSEARIAVLAPDPAACRAELARVFRRVLMPEELIEAAAASAQAALPFEFSLGGSLAAVPPIAAGLSLLRWLRAPLPAPELTWLLTSGYAAASPEEAAAQARLDTELRRAKNSAPEVALAGLLHRRHTSGLPLSTRARLERLLTRARREGIASAAPATPRRESYSHWAELAADLLAEAGWPGYRTADSVAYQAQQRWTRLLSEIAQLDFDGERVSWGDFLSTLQAEAGAVIFAPESTGAPIQILGAFESSGQHFDALWFLGADDGRWPSVGRPHPLLPLGLQIEAGMPHATAEADWSLAQGTTTRILRSAPRVVFSYAAQRDGAEQRPSPLLPFENGAQPEAAVPEPLPILHSISPEQVADNSGHIPWPADQVAGGAEILRRQAACAFQSFATRRLRADALEQADVGMDAAERGTLLHEVLERLWSEKPGEPERLHELADLQRVLAAGTLPALLEHHIRAALEKRSFEADNSAWEQSYRQCEIDRIRDLLGEWLAYEAGRQPFAIKHLEKEFEDVAVGELRLNLRVDRVDSLADDSLLLIDYKTGRVAVGAWEGDRPDEPQLPLYALFTGLAQVSGIAFGQIRVHEAKLLFRSQQPEALVLASPGSSASRCTLDEPRRTSWRGALLQLAEQFTAGEAQLNPHKGRDTCKWCPLATLCRVHTLPAALPDETADEMEEDLDG